MRFQYRYPLVAAALMAAFVLALAAAPVFRGPDRARAAEITIDIGNFWFCDPSFEGGVCETTIQVGDTVTWNWVEGNHTTTECGADCDNPTETPLWDAPLDSANPTFSRTFDTPGTYLYLCGIHPVLMRGRIIVEEVSPTPTPTPMLEATPEATPTLVAETPTPVAETPPPAPPVEETPPAVETATPTVGPPGPPRTPVPPATPAPEGPEVIAPPPVAPPPTGAGSASGGSWPWRWLVVAGIAAVPAGLLLAYQGRRVKP